MSRDRFPAGANGKTREAWARRQIALAFGMRPHEAMLYLQGVVREAFGQGKRAGVALGDFARPLDTVSAMIDKATGLDNVARLQGERDRLAAAVRLDCQPKSEADAVLVSGAWRDRVLVLANAAPPPPAEAEAIRAHVEGSAP